MKSWALLLEYDGTPYVGWQRQTNGLSIQAVLEQACAQLNGGEPVAATAAGRTDAGVHAAGQIVQIALPDRYHADQLRDALNFHLKPHPIAVLQAASAEPGWSPRFDATQRAYSFQILNRRARPALALHRAWHVERALDEAAMLDAAQSLLGQHDFTSFRASACQAKSPIRTLDRLDVARVGDTLTVTAVARSFLHHQVRNMVGTLKLVGEGRWRAGQVRAALEARDRRAAGPTAPSDGLTLASVHYVRDPFGPRSIIPS